VASTYMWARTVTPIPCSSVSRWRQQYPLPIAKAALIQSAPYLPEVYEAIPFEGDETALWALRVESGSDTLDLFGLAGDRVKENQVSVGELSYSLRGQNTTFFEVVHLARTWWARFRSLPVGGGGR
jgi:hypothetical protein